MKKEIVRVTKIFTFDMAHALYGYDGSCRNIHGHTYHLHVTISGVPLKTRKSPKSGMVIDFSDLKAVVRQYITETFDQSLVLNGSSPHRKMKDLSDQFEKVIYFPVQPSCENLLIHFKNLLQPCFKGNLKLVYLKLHETPTSYSEWFLSDNKN